MTGLLALARLDAALFVRSQRFALPLVAYAVGAGLIFLPPAEPVLAVYGTTAAALYPLAAWVAVLSLSSESTAQRQVAATVVGSVARAWSARLLTIAAAVWALAILTAVLPALAGVFPRSPSAGEFGAGLAAMLFAVTGGATVGVFASVGFAASVGWRTIACCGLLIASIPLGDAGWAAAILPPSVPIAQLLDRSTAPPLGAWLEHVVGPFAIAMVLAAAVIALLIRRTD